MYKKKFAEYISKRSTAHSIKNAFFVYPDFVEQRNALFVYQYLGGASKPYNIEILLDKLNNIQQTSCSCPYNYSGLCKHIIACIEDLAERLDNGINNTSTIVFDMNFLNKSKEPLGTVLLENGQFNLAELQEKTKGRSTFFDIHFNQIDFTSIETSIKDWRGGNAFIQKIILDESKEKLATSCTCSDVRDFCEHRTSVFENITRRFGRSFFHKNFLESRIGEVLLEYGLTIEDDYQQYFDVDLTGYGVKLKEKSSSFRLQRYDTALVNYTEDTDLVAQLNIPVQRTTEEHFAAGLCMDFSKDYSKRKFLSFYPVKGKLNKDQTDFSSKISRVYYESFGQVLEDFSDAADFNYITDAMLLEKYLDNYNVSSRQKALKVFGDLVKQKPDFIYIHHVKDSYARKNLTRLEIMDESVDLYFMVDRLYDNRFRVKTKVKILDGKYNIDSSKLIVTPLFVIFNNSQLFLIKNPKLSFDLMHLSEKPLMEFYTKDTAYFYEKILLPLSKNYEVDSNFLKIAKKKKEEQEVSLEKHLYISDLIEGYVVFKPFVKYGEKLVPLYSNEIVPVAYSDGKPQIKYIERDEAFEDNFLEELRALHPDFELQDAVFYLEPTQLLENYWLMTAVEKMKNAGILVFGANDLKSFKFNVYKPTIDVRLESETDWFDIKIDVKFGEQSVSLKDLQKAFIKQNNYVLLNDGTTGILPQDWMKKFAVYFKSGEIKKDGIQLSNYQFGIIDELYDELHEKPAFFEQLYQKKQRLLNLTDIPNVEVPKEINATLRHYQCDGLNWLAFLEENQLGGCLADDMGLGKTLQTIAFLQYLKNKNPNTPPTLIIAPTSLIFNWMSEIEKFAPSLKALSFTGANRMEHRESFDQYNVILSTYGSLLNDIEFLKDYKFNYVILDESQAIKNPLSKRYKAVRLLNAHNRLVLTGTPIENNTFDLYAQLNFLNPGLLGTMTHFKKNFSDYIDKEADEEVSNTLGRIINPFVLRRTKEQVATELPEKVESVIYCEMNAPQRKVYEAFKNKFRDYILKQIEDNGVANSQMYILEGLTKLRQICNSTALINEEEDYGNYSAKLDVLLETIKEKTGKHKILVFSQFVGMLQLIQKRLDAENIVYEYLDGSTRNRQERVDNFQKNPEIRVFLISLKAGGTGLNLTEADYVFLVDPWWNPAVENQAIDRSYRIGQQKKVMAYRMICKDTIEEKIVALQSKKKAVASNIITIDEQQKSFDVADIKRLFS